MTDLDGEKARVKALALTMAEANHDLPNGSALKFTDQDATFLEGVATLGSVPMRDADRDQLRALATKIRCILPTPGVSDR